MEKDLQLLETRRDELVTRLEAIRRDVGRGLEKDFEEQAIQLENLEVLQEIARLAEEELRKLEITLARLKAAQSE